MPQFIIQLNVYAAKSHSRLDFIILGFAYPQIKRGRSEQVQLEFQVDYSLTSNGECWRKKCFSFTNTVCWFGWLIFLFTVLQDSVTLIWMKSFKASAPLGLRTKFKLETLKLAMLQEMMDFFKLLEVCLLENNK